MLEVESKFRSPGNDRVVARLDEMGATRLSDDIYDDVYYAHPCRAFGQTDEALRLRSHGERSELTYKGPRMGTCSTKAREELTLEVDNALSLNRILERLGFREIACVRKRRISFTLDLLGVDVDEVEGLGQFVELELMTEDPSRAEELIGRAKEGLHLGERVEDTYLEMILKGR